MAHHKKKKPRNCRMCSIQKHHAFKGKFDYQLRQEQISMVDEKEQLEEFYGLSEQRPQD